MSQLFMPSSPADSQAAREFEGVFLDVPPVNAQFLFAAATAQVAHLADVLALVSAVGRYALMVLSRHGITFFAEYNHIVNAQVAVDAALFSAYEYHWTGGDESDLEGQKNVQLGVDVHMLNEAFAAAAATVMPKSRGSTTLAHTDTVVCYIKYRGDGHPLVVEFEDRLMSEQIEFATFHLDIEFPYGAENPELQADTGDWDPHTLTINHLALRFEVILQSDIFANLLQDLQNLGTEDLYMYVSNRDTDQGLGLVHFISKGAIGYLKLVYPNARTMLQKLEVYAENGGEPISTLDSVLCTLGFAPFIRIFRAVKLSSKCKIMKDTHGVLAVQLLCKNTAAKGYPGTLIAFNMLEKSEVGGTGQAVAFDANGLFDDNVYQQVREYEPGNTTNTNIPNLNHDDPPLSATEPFSYAAFKRPSGGDLAPKRSRQNEESGSVRDSADFPVFL